MEFKFIECPQCHRKDGHWDSKRLTYSCEWCNETFPFQRKAVNADEGVRKCAANAVRSFKDSQYAMAVNMAMDALEVSYDNAPSKFIIAYNDEVINKKMGALKKFFDETENLELDIAEVEALEELFIATPKRLIDFEEQLINMIAKNSQNTQPEKVAEFFDKLCPYFIANRTSFNFLTPKLAEMYAELASYCDVQKICYALYNAIVKISDSPCVDNSFFLKTKCRNFYDNFVLPIGDIIKSMRTPALNQKFSAAYESRRAQILAKMQE